MVYAKMFSILSPCFAPIVDYLNDLNRIGLCQRVINIKECKTGCVSTEEQPNCDRFKINIPYAGLNLTWEVIFNHEYPELPPDFIFEPDELRFEPNVDNLKSLANWDPNKPSALVDVIAELLAEFKRYHLSVMESHSRLQCEYSEILEFEQGYKFSSDDIEVFVNKKNGIIGQVNFMLRLPIDFKKLPVYLTRNNPGEDTALLHLVMEAPDKHIVRPHLFLSPRVRHVLGPVENLAVPPFPEQGLLIDYIPVVCELLSKKVKEIISSYELRRDFCNGFLAYYDSCVLEFDGEGFKKISALMEWHDFFFITTVEFPANFPTSAPLLSWQSIYHEDKEDEKPYILRNQTFPFSPRWKASEMVERLRQHILENVKEFQKKSVMEGRVSMDK